MGTQVKHFLGQLKPSKTTFLKLAFRLNLLHIPMKPVISTCCLNMGSLNMVDLSMGTPNKWSTLRTLIFFIFSGLSNLSETIFRKMLPLQLNSILLKLGTSRKRMAHARILSASRYSDGADETNTNTKRRRRIGPHAPSSANDPLNDNPPAPVSDDELERRAVHVFNTDPWLWSVSDVYFALTNVRSYDLRQLDNPDLDDLHLGNLTPPHPHIGLILIKFIIDGPKLLVNVTQPWLMGLGITRADHLAATRFVLDKIRLRSPTYQHHQKHILNPIPMLSTQTAGPQSPESRQAVLDSIRQQIATKPLKDGETRNYHLVFGWFVAVVTGPNGQSIFSSTLSLSVWR